MSYYIGVDLGTSSLKLLLVTETGSIARTVSRAYPVDFPHPGWSEQSPTLWWDALCDGFGELLADIDAHSVHSIGIGGQMHGAVILDETGAVIRPAILWNDGRTADQTAYLNEVVGKARLSQLTANIAFAGFTAPKLLWLRENEPQNFVKIHKVLLPKDYLTFRLTGKYCTDYSDAAGTLLLDVKNKCWSQEMLDICGMTQAQMPALLESYQVVGTLLPEIAEQLGLSSRVTVVAGAGDNAAAAVGTGTVGNGRCNISLGTSGTVFIATDVFCNDPCNALHAFCHANSGHHLMGCILSAASCNKWFCEDILHTSDFATEEAAVTEKALSRNHVYFLPYLMGERSPINDTDARGMFIGMRMDTTRKDMFQAVLEGVCFAIKENIAIAQKAGIEIPYATLCGGGAKSALWQTILANVLNIPLYLPQTEQGPAYGAAMLAMVGDRQYTDLSACAAALVKTRKVIHPTPAIAAQYAQQYKVFKRLYPTVKNLYKELHQ